MHELTIIAIGLCTGSFLALIQVTVLEKIISKYEKNNGFLNILSNSHTLELEKIVKKITPETIERKLSERDQEKSEAILFKFWFEIPQNYSLKTLENKILKKSRLINWQNLIKSSFFNANTGIEVELDDLIIIDKEESIKAPSLKKLFVYLNKAKLNPEIRLGIFWKDTRKVGCAVVTIAH